MEHMKILGIKFAVIFVIVLSMFGIFDHMPIVNLFWISLLTTAVSYVVGDLFLFKWFGNVVALVLDFGLAFVMFWFLGNFFIGTGYPVIPMAFFLQHSSSFVVNYLFMDICYIYFLKQINLWKLGIFVHSRNCK